jgi:hypothetical protein
MSTTVSTFVEPGAMTAPGHHAHLFAGLPGDPAELAAIIQGLLLHEFFAPAYGVDLSEERRGTVHLRPVEQWLASIAAEDGRPLTVPRPPSSRLVANCRHFTVLLVAMLRAQNIPARARCGFGTYFIPGSFEDHWVAEYWNEAAGRWVLVDAQIDSTQRAMLPIDFDLMDVPRDRFLVAGEAWSRCRTGAADPDRFGLSEINEAGLWWVAGNLLRDTAALNKRELLPWDEWGAMPSPEAAIGEDELALFDRLATLTEAPDRSIDELRTIYERDDRVRVPPVVFNGRRQRDEPI